MNIDRRPGSRLPDDPAYWQRLAARSVEQAFATGDAHVASHGDIGPVDREEGGRSRIRPHNGASVASSPWWRDLSDAAFMLAASALFALVGGSLLLEERSPATTAETHALTSAIAPDDDLLSSLMSAEAPPPAIAMLRVVARREVER